jgi:hypothetical protein
MTPDKLPATHGVRAGLLALLLAYGAWCENGLLGIEIPHEEQKHFHDILSAFGIYHDFDYGLSYANIRENALLRVRSWKGTR